MDGMFGFSVSVESALSWYHSLSFNIRLLEDGFLEYAS